MIGEAIRELLELHKHEREEKLSQTERKRLELKKRREQIELKLELRGREEQQIATITSRNIKKQLESLEEENIRAKERNERLIYDFGDSVTRCINLTSSGTSKDSALFQYKKNYYTIVIGMYRQWEKDKLRNIELKEAKLNRTMEEIEQKRKSENQEFDKEVKLRETLAQKKHDLLLIAERERKDRLQRELQREKLDLEDEEISRTFKEMTQKAKNQWQQFQKKTLSDEIQVDVQKFQGELENIIGDLYISPNEKKKRKEKGKSESSLDSPEKSSKKSKKEGKEKKHKRENSPISEEKSKKKKEPEKGDSPIKIKGKKNEEETQSHLLELWNRELEKSIPLKSTLEETKKPRGALKVDVSEEQIRFAVERPPSAISKSELKTDTSYPRLEQASSSVKEITVPFEKPKEIAIKKDISKETSPNIESLILKEPIKILQEEVFLESKTSKAIEIKKQTPLRLNLKPLATIAEEKEEEEDEFSFLSQPISKKSIPTVKETASSPSGSSPKTKSSVALQFPVMMSISTEEVKPITIHTGESSPALKDKPLSSGGVKRLSSFPKMLDFSKQPAFQNIKKNSVIDDSFGIALGTSENKDNSDDDDEFL